MNDQYDNHDVNHPDSNPAPPVCDGFTMGVCSTVVVGLIIWLMIRMFG